MLRRDPFKHFGFQLLHRENASKIIGASIPITILAAAAALMPLQRPSERD